MRIIPYSTALREAIAHEMKADPSVFVMGMGVDDFKGMFGSTMGLAEEFGAERCFDTPISEGNTSGMAIGAALNGMRPIHCHIRMDFLYLAMDQLFNMAAKWHYMFGGKMSVPIVVRAVIGRSWGQGAQHSQSLQALFAHIPGLKVIMPATARDAKGMLISAIRDENPVISIEHRFLYDTVDDVPEESYEIPLGKARVMREGQDVTIAATSLAAIEALKAAEYLEKQGISAEIIDLRSIVPMDTETIIGSIRKTGRLIAVDTSWLTCGVTAELAAIASESCLNELKAPVRRIGTAQVPCPTTKSLERLFYPTVKTIVDAAYDAMGTPEAQRAEPSDEDTRTLVKEFKGPF